MPDRNTFTSEICLDKLPKASVPCTCSYITLVIAMFSECKKTQQRVLYAGPKRPVCFGLCALCTLKPWVGWTSEPEPTPHIVHILARSPHCTAVTLPAAHPASQ